MAGPTGGRASGVEDGRLSEQALESSRVRSEEEHIERTTGFQRNMKSGDRQQGGYGATGDCKHRNGQRKGE